MLTGIEKEQYMKKVFLPKSFFENISSQNFSLYDKLKLNKKALRLRNRKTLKNSVSFEGIGVHSGAQSKLAIYPTDSGKGLTFQRLDLKKHGSFNVSPETVNGLFMSTGIINNFGNRISTIEHLLASLYALGITDAHIEVDGPEIPILDGSSQEFTKAFIKTGTISSISKVPTIVVNKKFSFTKNDSEITVYPSDSRKISYWFDGYGRMDSLLGNKYFSCKVDDFEREISSARTFGFYEDGVVLKKQGLAIGASTDNTIVIRDGEVLNGVLRFEDEFIRHKILDLMGDISIGGVEIYGHIFAKNTGHKINNEFIKLFLQSTECWEYL